MHLFPTLHAVRRRLIPGSVALLAALGLADPASAQQEHGFYVTGGEIVYIQGEYLTVGLPENVPFPPQEERHVRVDQESQIIIDNPGGFNLTGDFENQNPIRNPFAIGATTNGTVYFCNRVASSNQQMKDNPTIYPNLWLMGLETLKSVEADATVWAGGQLTMLSRNGNLGQRELRCNVVSGRRLHVLNTDPASVRIKPGGYSHLDADLNLGYVSTEAFARFVRRVDRTAQYLFPLGSVESPSGDKGRPLFVDPSVNETRDLATRLGWEDASVDPEGPYNREERDTNLCEINPIFFHIMEDENERIQGQAPVAYNNLIVRYTQSDDGVWNTLTKHDAPENKWFDTQAPDNPSTGTGAYELVPVWNSGATPIDNLNNPAFALGRFKPVGCFTYDPGPRVRINDPITFTADSQDVRRANDFNFTWLIQELNPDGTIKDEYTITSPNGRPEITETFEDPARYIVTLVTVNKGSDEAACTEVCTDTITVEPRTAFILPDGFTPGTGDILNEHFTFYFYGFSEATLRIFDRWGLEVFNYTYTDDDGAETKPVESYAPQGQGYWDSKYWNGCYKNDRNKPCQEDVYTYSIKAKTLDSGKEYDRKGTITLIR